MRKANDIIGQIYLVIFFLVMCATPIAILIIGIVNFVRAKSRRGTIVLQNLASQIVWMVLSYAVFLILIMIAVNQKFPTTSADEWKTTGWFVLVGVIYLAIGAALIYWTRQQAKLSQAAPVADKGADSSLSQTALQKTPASRSF